MMVVAERGEGERNLGQMFNPQCEGPVPPWKENRAKNYPPSTITTYERSIGSIVPTTIDSLLLP